VKVGTKLLHKIRLLGIKIQAN